jgi:hypothetical protein
MSSLDPIRLADFREALWLLGYLHPQHKWLRRSGSPMRQLERNGFQPPEETRERGYRALTAQGKQFFAKWANREGLPVPQPPQRQSIADRYGPPRLR